jgi:hypothetical protein
MSATLSCSKSAVHQASLFGGVLPNTSSATPCAKAILGYYTGVGSIWPASHLRALAARDGYPESTVSRTLAKLIAHGSLEYVRGGLALTGIDPPASGAYSHASTARKFGCQSDTQEAEYVRGYYSDRLDTLFEIPTCELMAVMRAVTLAGKIAQALCGGSISAAKEAAEGLRELMQQSFPGGLSECTLLDALHVGLFPEDYVDDEEFAASIAKHRAAAEERRAQVVRETIEQNQQIAAENADRVEIGLRKLPFVELPTELFDGRSSDFLAGLVPLGGGARMGDARLAAWRRVVGV